ncbi:MAG TPA: NfeD family protein [Candidatus Eisenbacteria bacterium]|nr:NfeD family protein [Candidatus Eisenbacteria bacterium]
MRTFAKYLLFQLPQWLILGLFLWFLVDKTAVPRWAGVGFFVFWVVKDLAMYPFVRSAYENDSRTGAEQLIGQIGVARENLAPKGYIKIQGELWKALAKSNAIPQNRPVKVIGAEGMTLIVEPDDGKG